VKGYVHPALALVCTLAVVWLSDLPQSREIAALAAGAVIGALAGAVDARSIERRLDPIHGLHLYDEDALAFVIPVAVIASAPFASGSAIALISRSETLQGGLQAIICGLAAFWLCHDVVLGRQLKRLEQRMGPLRVRRFYARSIVGPQDLIGQTGVVTRTDPRTYVRVKGELWFAQCGDARQLREGDSVVITGITGLSVAVERRPPAGEGEVRR
jgi:membrane protein implicated in regulation of membrane protease activity